MVRGIVRTLGSLGIAGMLLVTMGGWTGCPSEEEAQKRIQTAEQIMYGADLKIEIPVSVDHGSPCETHLNDPSCAEYWRTKGKK